MKHHGFPWESGRSFLRGSLNAALLGGGVGSLYLALLGALEIPGGIRISAFLAIFLGGTLLSSPVLFLATLLMGSLLIPWLARYHRQQTLIFGFAGGILGATLPIALILAAVITDILPPVANLPIMMIYFKIVTIGFCYGGATGMFTALDLR